MSFVAGIMVFVHCRLPIDGRVLIDIRHGKLSESLDGELELLILLMEPPGKF